MMEDRVKSAIKEAEKEKALKEVTEATMPEKIVSALGVPKDSPFKITKKIPYPGSPPPPVQNLARVEDEDNQSIRVLVEEIDSHAKLIDLEISCDPNANQGQAFQLIPNLDL
nr:hypothetical protein CFP56_61412 [Quercus suber]